MKTPRKQTAENFIKDIRRNTRRIFSSEQKIQIVMEALRAEMSVAELGRDPIIASVSFGEERRFQLKHITNNEIKLTLKLNHGSLLLMKEGSQIHYKHQIPKASSSKKQRINLTFRTIL